MKSAIAKNSVNAFLAQQVQPAPQIGYSEESIKKINQAILSLLKDVVDGQVELFRCTKLNKKGGNSLLMPPFIIVQ